MLTAYLTTLIIGGSLLGLSIFGGGDHEVDHDLDVGTDADLEVSGYLAGDVDADADAGHHGGGLDAHGLDAWLPIGSLRFWTFFCAFFGLVGTALTLATGLGTAMVLAPSIGVGYLSGVGATSVMRSLVSKPVGKVLGAGDLMGSTGVLLLPVEPGSPGKVRLQIGGRSFEEIAISEEETLAAGARVLVIGTDDEGNLIVSHAPLLNA